MNGGRAHAISIFLCFLCLLFAQLQPEKQRLGQMLKKTVCSCEPTSGQYVSLGKRPCSCWPDSPTMLGNPGVASAASDLPNSGMYLGGHEGRPRNTPPSFSAGHSSRPRSRTACAVGPFIIFSFSALLLQGRVLAGGQVE